MSTIYDVAEIAGVSPSTVSRVFSQSQRVSESTRTRVLKAAQDIGYKPKMTARALTAKHTLMIGLVISDIQNPYSSALVRGVQDLTAKEGYVSIVCSTDDDPDKEIKILHEMIRRNVDGFIVTPSQFGVNEKVHAYIRRLLGKSLPIVFVGNQLDETNVSYVTSFAQDGAIQAVNYLAKLGHKRIGFIGGHYTKGVAVGRWLGYQEAMIANRLPIDSDLMVEANLSSEDGEAAMKQFLSLAEPPTAVLTVNDLVAVGAMSRCQQAGVSVPEQMSIIGFDDIPLAEITVPPLTTVAQPAYELGYQAASLLLDHCQNPELSPRHMLLRSSLVVRGSAAVPVA